MVQKLDLAKQVKKGCEDDHLVGLIFNTVGVSDGQTMGTQGMILLSYPLGQRYQRFSLPKG